MFLDESTAACKEANTFHHLFCNYSDVVVKINNSRLYVFVTNTICQLWYVAYNMAHIIWPSPWWERRIQRVYQMCILLHVQSKENLSLLPCSLEHIHKPSLFLVITHSLDKLRLLLVTPVTICHQYLSPICVDNIDVTWLNKFYS